jgi:hypothetical protein
MRVIMGMAAAMLAATMAAPASAQQTDGFYTAGRMNEKCKTDMVWCKGYIIGVVDGVMAYTTYSKGVRIVCLAQGTDADTIVDIVLKHLAANPAKWEYDAAGQIMLALHNANPCQH